MKKTNPVFSLKNFRSFGADGADFELAPITVLTGCNSAGKSSLVKALMLLSNQPKENSMSSSAYEIKRFLPEQKLNISAKDLMLGTFDKVLNDKAENKEIVLSYKIWSDFLQETIVVKRVFIPIAGDVQNNGMLTSFSIEKNDGSLISLSTFGYDLFPREVKKNFNVIEDNYDRFLKVVDYFRAKQLYKAKDSADSKYLEKITLWYEKSASVLESNGIQAESYDEQNLGIWIGYYYPIFNNEENAFFKSVRTEQEVENEKKESFISLIINETVRPWFIAGNINYVNSSSALINRLYSSEDDDKVCRALRTWNNRKYEEFFADTVGKAYHPGQFLNRWIKEFQIGESVELEGTTEGLGFLVYLIKDGKKRLLADEGYGISQLVSLLLQIDNNIELYNDPFDPRPEQLMCVEEPENHLHPKFQSLLADMFVEAYQKHNIRFIIETHSEYLIRKLQVMVADKETSLVSGDVSLNYVEKNDEGISHNRQIKILDDGSLSESFGSGFYDEADTLAIQLFRNKPILS